MIKFIYFLPIIFLSHNVLGDPEVIDYSKWTKEDFAKFNGTMPYADFSNTIVTIEYEVNSDGNYVYSYAIESKPNNINYIFYFSLDIECKYLPIERHGYKPEKSDYGSILLDNKKYIQYGIGDSKHENPHESPETLSYQALWFLDLKPGEVKHGFQIISKNPPVNREYKLEPSWDEGDPIPQGAKYCDYTTTGTTIGPGCHTDNILNDPNTLENVLKKKEEYLKAKKENEEKLRIKQMNTQPVMCVGSGCFN